MQDSLEVAQYYMAKRGIPSQNLLGVQALSNGSYGSPDDSEYSSYSDLQTYLVQPLQNKLNQLGQTNIDLIVMAYKMPVVVGGTPNGNVSLDDMIMAPFYWSATTENVYQSSNPYFGGAPTFTKDQPRFSHTFKFNNTNMYMVGRLDNAVGLSYVLNQIDQALYADKYFVNQPGYFNGKAYVNNYQCGVYTDAGLAANSVVQTGNYTSYCDVDANIGYTEHYLAQAGMPFEWQNGHDSIGSIWRAYYSDGTSAITAKNAFLYAGWYKNAYNLWDWLPGSVASDLNSSSLNLRTYECTGGVPCERDQFAVMNGVSAISGVVNEPYTTGNPRPNILVYYLLKGYTFAEAATLSYADLGWMEISIGDPMYAPFASKPLIKDYQQPQLAATPTLTVGPNPADRTLKLLISDAAGPKVVKAVVEYGLDTSYGSQVTSGGGFFRRLSLTMPSLQASTTYHFRLRLIDPSGNNTLTGDYSFNTGDTANTITAPPAPAGTLALTVQPQTLQATSKIGAVVDAAVSGGSGNYSARWSVVSGPGAVTFADPARITPTAYFSAPGAYALSVTVSDGTQSTSQNVALNVVNPDPSLKFDTFFFTSSGAPVSYRRITSPGNFEAILNADLSGVVSLFDLKNDPDRNWNIAGNTDDMNLWLYCWPSGGVSRGACASNSVTNVGYGVASPAAAVVLDTNPVRIRFNNSYTLQGVPYTVTYSIYANGKMVADHDLVNNTPGPLTFSLARYYMSSQQLSDSNAMLVNTNSWSQIYGGGAFPPFSLVQYLIQSNFFAATGNYSAGLTDEVGYTLPAGATERVIVNHAISPDATVLSTSAGVNAYEQDFQTPAALAFNSGSAYTSDPADANHDGFVEGEGAYALNAAGGTVTFSMDGTTIARHSPAFKVFNFSSASAQVIKDGVALKAGQDYVAAPIGGSTLLVQYLGNVTGLSTFSISPR